MKFKNLVGVAMLLAYAYPSIAKAVDYYGSMDVGAFSKMTKDDVLHALKGAEAELRAKGVARAALFGSVARGDQRPDSDIDIMVELDPASQLGLWEYVGVINFIEDMFPVKVDVSNRASLKPYVRPSAERDAIYAF